MTVDKKGGSVWLRLLRGAIHSCGFFRVIGWLRDVGALSGLSHHGALDNDLTPLVARNWRVTPKSALFAR